MLEKLLKYDLKALSRILIPTHIAVIVVGIVACGAGLLGYASSTILDTMASRLSDLTNALMAMAALTLVLCILLLFSATVTTFVVVLNRFYRNLFTDEGYLTLTLPATAGQQVASKIIAGLLWMIIDALVVFACLLAISAAAEGFSSSFDLSDSIPVWVLGVASGDILGTFDGPTTVSTITSWGLRSILQMLFMLLLAYASLALGAALAARHKIACGIGLFIGIWFAYGMITGFLGIMLGFTLSFDYEIALTTIAGANACLQLLMIAGFWALCVWVLKRKVNLS